MEENGDDVCYSTVSIKNGKPPPKENEEDETVYSEVKRKKTGPAETIQAEKETAAPCHSALLFVCLGILCVLLVVSIGVIIYMSIEMKKQQGDISNLSTKNKRLTEDRKTMQNQNKELSRERDDLNRTLGFIMKFDNFPVKDFCPDKKCQPCLKGWITFQEKCYLFYNEDSWKTWKDSREFCLGKHSDLVVIDDLQEQPGDPGADRKGRTHRPPMLTNLSAITLNTTIVKTMDTGWGYMKLTTLGSGSMDMKTLSGFG